MSLDSMKLDLAGSSVEETAASCGQVLVIQNWNHLQTWKSPALSCFLESEDESLNFFYIWPGLDSIGSSALNLRMLGRRSWSKRAVGSETCHSFESHDANASLIMYMPPKSKNSFKFPPNNPKKGVVHEQWS
jgi:hypothetical protein